MGCDCLVKAIGYAAVTLVLSKIASHVWQILYPYVIGAKKDLRKLAGANTAVVTGATDGIGKAYAFELAKKGFNLVLISRTQSKLDETAKEITDKHSDVKVDTISFDFSVGDVKNYEERLFNQLDKYEIGVLVNNVGMSYEYPERLHDIDGGLARVAGITIINTLPCTLLSAYVLKKMAARKNGVVINISSSASAKPLAYWAIYSATKKYVNWLSEIMRKEYAGKGVTIQTIAPMMVATKMSKVRKSSFFIPQASAYARAALGTVGLADETTGYLSHQLQHDLYFNVLPDWVFNYMANQNSLATRARALKKKAQKQE
ncbi:unnamed protein product [Bursaphelenchus xylophilus]|uniref:(pine wood nematode) hypothetical protein n=1 Tax=Bursaphelenchus xylophilus TaxID=6326 RepID=A0A1I7SWT7_BURXY|nr:unnamed protein product [Bursaphelenchus xylophilus]CAG9099907.1 unnamed protein product [Bursaphelenchus xylophilus]